VLVAVMGDVTQRRPTSTRPALGSSAIGFRLGARFEGVGDCHLTTDRLELRPLSAKAAAALQDDRGQASHLLGVTLSADWPLRDLLDVLPVQAATPPNGERFGVWVIIERRSTTVVGDIGFFGPPDSAGSLEVGYSIVPDRRRLGYASEAAAALVTWALEQPGVATIVAACDADNAASILTLDRVGFRRTGEAEGRIFWKYTEKAGLPSEDGVAP